MRGLRARCSSIELEARVSFHTVSLAAHRRPLSSDPVPLGRVPSIPRRLIVAVFLRRVMLASVADMTRVPRPGTVYHYFFVSCIILERVKEPAATKSTKQTHVTYAFLPFRTPSRS